MNYFNYFSEIEETFVRRRGRNLLLSPLDWTLIEGWRESGIPLHIVLGAIDHVFDNHEANKKIRAIKTLAFCADEVEARFAEWKEAQAGKSEAAEGTKTNARDEIAKTLVKFANALAAVSITEIKAFADLAAGKLSAFAVDLPVNDEEIEAVLRNIEDSLTADIKQNWDPAHLKQLDKEISEELSAYRKTMDAENYRNTANLMLLKRLRSEAGIPRLSLFFL